MRKISVALIRRLAPFLSRTGYWDFRCLAPGKSQRWHEIEDKWRVLILADPGAGKTFEALSRARRWWDHGIETLCRIRRVCRPRE